MNAQMANHLKVELSDAIEAHDKEKIDKTMARAMGELVDCQFKTSERVKNIEVLIDRQKARLEGAQIAMKALKWAGLIGGGASVGYAAKALGGLF